MGLTMDSVFSISGFYLGPFIGY